MYLSHFNLKEKPFQISTNPKFLWLGEQHKEALATLKYGIMDNRGFLLLTGDVGTGKTTLIHALTRVLGKNIILATVLDPGLDIMDFLNYIAQAFGMDRSFKDKGVFLFAFRDFLYEAYRQKKRPLLIIDEAQRLNAELIEEIRLLSNIERQDTKLLNIFFVGQNEFNNILLKKENRALRQRITINFNIEALNEIETGKYIAYRLKKAGASKNMFTAGAVREIYRFSNGYPRLINIICDHALLTGYVEEKNTITEKIILECGDELRISSHRHEPFEDRWEYNEKFIYSTPYIEPEIEEKRERIERVIDKPLYKKPRLPPKKEDTQKAGLPQPYKVVPPAIGRVKKKKRTRGVMATLLLLLIASGYLYSAMGYPYLPVTAVQSIERTYRDLNYFLTYYWPWGKHKTNLVSREDYRAAAGNYEFAVALDSSDTATVDERMTAWLKVSEQTPYIVEKNEADERIAGFLNFLLGELIKRELDPNVLDMDILSSYNIFRKEHIDHLSRNDADKMNRRIEVLKKAVRNYKSAISMDNSAIATVYEKMAAWQKVAGKKRNSPEKKKAVEKIKEINKIIDTTATITTVNNFVTCNKVDKQTRNPVKIKDKFRDGENVYVWARVKSPKKENLKLVWYAGGEAVKSTKLSVRWSQAFRTWAYTRSSLYTGLNEVRLYNSKGILIGRKRFSISGS